MGDRGSSYVVVGMLVCVLRGEGVSVFVCVLGGNDAHVWSVMVVTGSL